MHITDRVTLARLPSGVPVETTVHVYEGEAADEDDPILYVQAAQHGREINGTEVLRRLHGRLDHESLGGRLIAVPVADPLTFDRVSYTTPESIDSVNANMNRVWPGDPEGTIHERMAATLWDYVGDADAIVDLHTGSPDMLTHCVYQDGRAESRELAEVFGTELLLAEAAGEDADDEWHDRGFEGKLRVAAAQEGIPAITPELSHNRQLDESAIETGCRGVLSLLRHLNLADGSPDRPDEQRVARNHLGRVRATESGLFQPSAAAELGTLIEDEEFLGRVHDPTSYGVLQEVTADREGYLYSVAREATVTAGQTLVGLALPKEE